jgi:hypothetical protein
LYWHSFELQFFSYNKKWWKSWILTSKICLKIYIYIYNTPFVTTALDPKDRLSSAGVRVYLSDKRRKRKGLRIPFLNKVKYLLSWMNWDASLLVSHKLDISVPFVLFHDWPLFSCISSETSCHPQSRNPSPLNRLTSK